MESSFDWTKQDGWYVDFGTPGERLAVNMTLEFGTLVAVTTIPPNQDDPCAHSGSTWMYQLDALTGGIPPGASNAGNEVDATSVPTSNTYTEFPPNPLGSGSSSGVGGSTTQTNNGCPPGFVTVATSGNTTASGFHCSSQSSTTQINRISWRELVN
jgi:Tfp pilus tip-associated adhesin PilY1